MTWGQWGALHASKPRQARRSSLEACSRLFFSYGYVFPFLFFVTLGSFWRVQNIQGRASALQVAAVWRPAAAVASHCRTAAAALIPISILSKVAMFDACH